MESRSPVTPGSAIFVAACCPTERSAWRSRPLPLPRSPSAGPTWSEARMVCVPPGHPLRSSKPFEPTPMNTPAATLPAWQSSPCEHQHTFQLEPWYSWMDPLGHINHPDYLEWADESTARCLARAGLDPQKLVPVAERISWKRAVTAPAPGLCGISAGRPDRSWRCGHSASNRRSGWAAPRPGHHHPPARGARCRAPDRCAAAALGGLRARTEPLVQGSGQLIAPGDRDRLAGSPAASRRRLQRPRARCPALRGWMGLPRGPRRPAR